MSDLLQLLISGIAMGSIYTLMGKGLFITFLTTRALNFGQGDFLMISAFLSMALLLSGLPWAVAITLVVAAVVLLGIVLEQVAIRPLGRFRASSAGSLAWILTTMAFGMLLQNTAQLIWGKSRYYSPPLFAGEKGQVVTFLGARFYAEEVAVAVVALLVVGVLYWLLFRTKWGKQVATVSFDKSTASLLGINVRAVTASSYLIMAVLAAISGVLAGPLTSVQAHMGLLFILKGFAVVCIGGFVTPLGILVAGLGFGVLEAVSNYVESSFGDLYPFVIALGFLIFKPSGLFSEARADVR